MARKFDSKRKMSGKKISRIIADFDSSQYAINTAYFAGKNPPIIEEGLIKAAKKKKPNNIIPLPFGRRTINDLQGYAYKPGNVVYVYSDGTPEGSKKVIDEILTANDEEITSAEIFQNSGINGQGAELQYIAHKKIQFAQIPREQCIFKYDGTVKNNKLEWSIRVYQVKDVTATGDDVTSHMADLYTPKEIHHYKYIERAKDTKIDQKESQQSDLGVKGVEYEYQNSEIHPFSLVQLYPYNINSDRKGVFEPSIPIIDKLDGFGSDSIANAVDQFNDTILLLSKVIAETDVDKLRDMRLIDGLGGKEEGNFAEFLQRSLDIDGTLDSFKLMERLYYELTGVPNLNDEKFGLKSGIAIAYALVPFENLVTTMEIYFSKSLIHRIELMNNAMKFIRPSWKPVEVTVKWTRNLPFDWKQLVEIVVELKESGLLSDETILKMFPGEVVEDALVEMERKRNEDKEKITHMNDSQALLTTEPKFPNVGDDDEGDDE